MIYFREIVDADAALLMNWRLKPRIAEWMLTRISDDLVLQLNWVKKMRNMPDAYHWIIQYKDQDIGYAKCYDINTEDKSAYTGFYIGEENYAKLTFFCIREFYASLFEKFSLKALKVFVFPENPAIQLHDRAGHIYDDNVEPLRVNHPKRILYPYILHKDVFRKKYPYKSVALLSETLRLSTVQENR